MSFDEQSRNADFGRETSAGRPGSPGGSGKSIAEDEVRLAEIRAARLGCRFFDVRYANIPDDVLALVPRRIAHEYNILPLTTDGEALDVAAAAPLSPETLDRLRFIINRPIHVLLSARNHLQQALDKFYGPAEPQTGSADPSAGTPATAKSSEPVSSAHSGEAEAESPFHEIPEISLAYDPDSAIIAKHIQNLLSRGMHLGAECLLLLPYKGRVKVAYQVNGLSVTDGDLAADLLVPMCTRLMAMLDFYGVIRIMAKGQPRRLRVHFHGTRFGPSVFVALGGDEAAAERAREKAAQQGYTYHSLENLVLPNELLAQVPPEVAREHTVLPVRSSGETLVLAASEPRSPQALDELRFQLNRPVEIVLAAEGRLRSWIERCYGPEDSEAAPVVMAEMARSRKLLEQAGRSEERALRRPAVEEGHPAHAVMSLLRGLGKEPLFDLFDDIAQRAELCRPQADGSLEIVLPHSHVIGILPGAARRYLEDRVTALRQAILAQLENLLLSDPTILGVGMCYALYVAACRLGGSERVTIDPGGMRHEWLNFLYSFALKKNRDLTTNAALISFLMQHGEQLREAVAAIFSDPIYMTDAKSSGQWLERLVATTYVHDLVDHASPMVARQLDVMIGEADHLRASHLIITPHAGQTEVAYRVHNRVLSRPVLPGCLTLPMLARLVLLVDRHGNWEPDFLATPTRVVAHLRVAPEGLAAVLQFDRDHRGVDEAQTMAAHAKRRFVRLADKVPAPDALALLPGVVALRMRLLPLEASDDHVVLATCRAITERRMQQWRGMFGRPVEPVMAPEDDIIAAIYCHYPMPCMSPPSETALYLFRKWTDLPSQHQEGRGDPPPESSD